jgi:hypothetical protein
MSEDSGEARAYLRRQGREAWLLRRRRQIREEIERNRRGEYVVPTWVLALLLAVIVLGWVLFVALS